MSAVNLIDLFRYGWVHLPATIVKGDGVSCWSNVNQFNLLTILY